MEAQCVARPLELNSLSEAAVDHNIRACCECGPRAGQKGHCVSNFVIGAHPAHRNAGDRRVVKVGHVSLDLLPRAAFEEDGPGADGIDSNA